MNSDGAERLWLKIRFAHAWLTTNRTVGSSVCVPSCVPLMIDGASLIHGGRSFVTAQRFQGKIAMVTGGNTGIGLDVAKAVRTGGCARSNINRLPAQVEAAIVAAKRAVASLFFRV